MTSVSETWSNRDIERDPQGNLEAQRRERQEQEAERARQNEEVALAQFTERFVAAGGERGQAASAIKAYRNEQAAGAARQADQRAPGYIPEQDEGGLDVVGYQYLNRLSAIVRRDALERLDDLLPDDEGEARATRMASKGFRPRPLWSALPAKLSASFLDPPGTARRAWRLDAVYRPSERLRKFVDRMPHMRHRCHKLAPTIPAL